MSIYETRRAPVSPADFDRWRAEYATTSYADQVAYYDGVWEKYPVQRHYNLPLAREFFAAPSGPTRVLEVGGWTGDVAVDILPQWPSIKDWLNVEVCRGAARAGYMVVPFASAYRAVVLEDWIWNQPEAFFEPFTVLFASHSFEHMTATNLRALLAKVTHISHVYIDTPLPEEPYDWHGYLGTHILELGWPQLIDLMAEFGWTLDRRDGTVGMFSR